MSSFYNDPIDDILSAMSIQNGGVNLVKGQYTFGDPAVLTPSEGIANTSIVVTALVPASPYQGPVTVKYRRLDLADLAKLVPISLLSDNIATTMDVATLLNTTYGFNFTSDDIVTSPVSLTDGVGVATLVAKPLSKGWVGTVDIALSKGGFAIDQYVTNRILPGLLYPDVDVTKPLATMYSYWRDFSGSKDTLTTVATGTGDLQKIHDVLLAVTSNDWLLSGVGRFSLDGATVSYNGPTSSYPRSNTTMYTNVCVIDLSASCQGYGGQLFLHYGSPNDDFA